MDTTTASLVILDSSAAATTDAVLLTEQTRWGFAIPVPPVVEPRFRADFFAGALPGTVIEADDDLYRRGSGLGYWIHMEETVIEGGEYGYATNETSTTDEMTRRFGTDQTLVRVLRLGGSPL